MAGLDAVAGVLGIIGVAQQLATSIVKIKRFCQDVKNAPDELLDTISTLENFSTMLMRLGEAQEASASDSRSTDILQGSLSLCVEAVQRIRTLSLDLVPDERGWNRRAAVKAALKQREIDRMVQKLDRSKADLQFAYTMYMDACRQEEYQYIRSYLDLDRDDSLQVLGSISKPVRSRDFGNGVDDCDDDQDNGLRKTRSHATRYVEQTSGVRIRFPFWLCRHAWDVALTRGCGQWTFSFKHINIITQDHPVCRLAIRNDIDGIRRLLDARQLSVHDEIICGDTGTLLNWAIENAGIDVVRLLLQSGASPDYHSQYGLFHLLAKSAGCHAETLQSIQNRLDRMRAMAQLVLPSIPDETEEFHESMAKTSSSWTEMERFRLAAFDDRLIGPEVERTSLYILDDHTIRNSLDFDGWDRNHQRMNVLHFLADRSRIIFADSWSRQMWSKAVQRHAALPSLLFDEHLVPYERWGEDWYTPFEMLLRTISRPNWKDAARQDVLQSWIRCLVDAGIELQLYGRREVRQKLAMYQWRWRTEGFISVTYGPKPEDWHVWCEHPCDLYAGMLWNLVENGYQLVPGAWVEDEYIPWKDQWRQGMSGREIGIKRRTLRRLRARMKCPETVTTDERGMIEDLEKCVSQKAEDKRDVSRGRGCDLNMLRLATSLGITTPEFRRWI